MSESKLGRMVTSAEYQAALDWWKGFSFPKPALSTGKSREEAFSETIVVALSSSAFEAERRERAEKMGPGDSIAGLRGIAKGVLGKAERENLNAAIDEFLEQQELNPRVVEVEPLPPPEPECCGTCVFRVVSDRGVTYCYAEPSPFPLRLRQSCPSGGKPIENPPCRHYRRKGGAK